MKNFLQQIVEQRKITVQQLKNDVPISTWEKMPYFESECLSLKYFLCNENLTGIIAEFKRASPSKGIINDTADIADVLSAYQMFGAAAASILSEPIFFKGSNDDVLDAKALIEIPILRKDFMFDEYQIVESKAIGADAILLIAASLTIAEVKRLAKFANGLGLEVLLELHGEEELEYICDEIDIVGINNRNLKTFEVDIDRSLRMAEKIPNNKIKIAESGISSIENILLFKQHGFKGFLIGENFMKEKNPADAFKNFTQQLKNK
jgi:indole-3-glycerol phosphate synthase